MRLRSGLHDTWTWMTSRASRGNLSPWARIAEGCLEVVAKAAQREQE